MPELCVAILASNNEAEIAECLESVTWAQDRLVILDIRSQDRTAEIARSMGARVVAHRFEDFARQREFGLGQTDCPWLFYLDSDERATPAVAEELQSVISEEDAVGWWVPRRNYILGKEIRYGGWHPDYQLRLLKIGAAHYDLARPVHEVVILEGQEGFLKQPLIHYNYRTLSQFRVKQRQYVTYEAQIRYQQGIRPKPWTYILQPLREFWRRYITLKGYRDGAHGFLLCGLVAYYYGFVVTWQLGQMHRESAKRGKK
jgi:(heptosyl)LPS beta-1,4-glucosyltransferase